MRRALATLILMRIACAQCLSLCGLYHLNSLTNMCCGRFHLYLRKLKLVSLGAKKHANIWERFDIPCWNHCIKYLASMTFAWERVRNYCCVVQAGHSGFKEEKCTSLSVFIIKVSTKISSCFSSVLSPSNMWLFEFLKVAARRTNSTNISEVVGAIAWLFVKGMVFPYVHIPQKCKGRWRWAGEVWWNRGYLNSSSRSRWSFISYVQVFFLLMGHCSKTPYFM